MKKPARKIFFNYGTVGLMGKPAYKAASTFLEEYYRVGPPEVLYKFEPYAKMLSKEISTLLNCREDEVTYTKNTSEGLTIASEALPLEKGDDVLVGANEYPAILLPWMKKKKDGITVRFVKGVYNEKSFENLIEAINLKTKVIVISWGQHYDGFLPDLELLSKICREKGIFLVVDAVHGVGTRVIDLKKTSIDILVSGGQKYLGGIMGIGFMYINKNLIPKLKDYKVGIRSMQSFDAHSYTLKDSAERFQDGTQNLLGIVALHAAIKHINSIGIKKIEKKNLTLLKKFKEHLTENKIPFIDHKNQCNIISIKDKDAEGLANFLRSNHIYIKAVKGVARISFNHDSSLKDFKTLVAKVLEWREKNTKKTQKAKRGRVASYFLVSPFARAVKRLEFLKREFKDMLVKIMLVEKTPKRRSVKA